MDLLSEHTRARRWPSVAAGVAALLYKYPRLFLPVLLHRVKRALMGPPAPTSGDGASQ
jgi:hypothetical protein